MAINPLTVKALFTKLVPYSDDAVRLASSYGDDLVKQSVQVSRGLQDAQRFTDYADDLGNLASRYGDDVQRMLSDASGKPVKFVNDSAVSIGDKVFHYPVSDSSQDLLKGKLLAKHAGLEHPQSLVHPLGELSKDLRGVPSVSYERLKDVGNSRLSDLAATLQGHRTIPSNARTAPTVDFIGDALPLGNRLFGAHGDTAIRNVGNLDARQMVAQTPVNPAYKASLRPHANTALGRWFASHRPAYVWENDIF